MSGRVMRMLVDLSGRTDPRLVGAAPSTDLSTRQNGFIEGAFQEDVTVRSWSLMIIDDALEKCRVTFGLVWLGLVLVW